MSFKEITGQDSALNFLETVYTTNRIAHAYLMIGPVGVGKRQVVVEFIKLLLCADVRQSQSCGQCIHCRRVEELKHPDLQWIVPENGVIKIESIREMTRRLNLKAFEARRKVIVLNDAQALNEESSNALLKTLEEPAGDSVLILLVSSKKDVLPTIVSRCQCVVFSSLSTDAVCSLLSKNYGVGVDQARFLSRYSEGSLGRAADYFTRDIFSQKNNKIDRFLDKKISLEAIEEFKTRDTFSRKKAAQELIFLISTWMRDIFVVKACGQDEVLIHQDRKEEIRSLAQKLSFNDIEEKLDLLADAEAAMTANANFKICFSNLRARL